MLALISLVFAAPCAPPVLPLVPAVLSSDGAAHVLARDASSVCWWVVDDSGDASVARQWPRAGREPVSLLSVPDGRFVVLLWSDGTVDAVWVDGDAGVAVNSEASAAPR